MSDKLPLPKFTEYSKGGLTYLWTRFYFGGKRHAITFGPKPDNSDDFFDVQDLFNRWVRLFRAQPHRTLAYKDPRQAVEAVVDPNAKLTVGELVSSYRKHAEATIKLTSSGGRSPNFQRWETGIAMTGDFQHYHVNEFGPDEFRSIGDKLVAYRYIAGKSAKPKSLTRRSVNMVMQELRRMFKWGVGRRIVDHAQRRARSNRQALLHAQSMKTIVACPQGRVQLRASELYLESILQHRLV